MVLRNDLLLRLLILQLIPTHQMLAYLPIARLYKLLDRTVINTVLAVFKATGIDCRHGRHIDTVQCLVVAVVV